MKKIVRIKNFPNRSFAEQAKDILDRNHIPCVLKSADLGILGSGGSSSLGQGVDLYVQAEYEQEAYDLLNALFNGI